MAAPAGYLSDDLDVFLIDANRQHRIDYPPVNSDDEGSGSSEGGSSESGSNESGSSESGSSENGSGESGRDDEDYEEEPYRPLSLLQWVGRRLVYDPAFGTTWRARILQLLDTYLQVYGQEIYPRRDENITHVVSDTVIEIMLSHFRPGAGDGSRLPPLLRAARLRRADAVHLLLLRGEPVSQNIPSSTLPVTNITALALALSDDGLDETWSMGDGMQTIFALIGAGADVTLVDDSARTVAKEVLSKAFDVPIGHVNFSRWPTIVNVRGLSVREFIADARSDYFDRIKLAMYLIAFDNGKEHYPGLE